MKTIGLFIIQLMLALTLTGQQPTRECLTCIVGEDPEETAIRHFVFETLQARYGMQQHGFYIAVGANDIYWVHFSFYMDEYRTELPSIAAYLPIKPDMKGTLKAFKERDGLKVTDRKKWSFTAIDEAANISWEIEVNDVGDFKSIRASKYNKDRPVNLSWCKEQSCVIECSGKDLATTFDEVGPLRLWTLTDGLDECEMHNFNNTGTFTAPQEIGDRWRYYSTAGHYWFELGKESKALERTGIDIRNYKGTLPLGLSFQTSLDELENRFGINYDQKKGRYELFLGKFYGQDEGVRLLVTFVLNDSQTSIDSLYIEHHPGYPKFEGEMPSSLSDLEQESGCIICYSSEGCTGYDCIFRFSNGYQVSGKMYEGRPVAGRLRNGFEEIRDFYNPELADWLKEQGIVLGPPEEEKEDVVVIEEPDEEPVARSCTEILYEVMGDDLLYLFELCDKFLDALAVVLEQKIYYGTYEQSAYDKMRSIGSSMGSTMGHIEMELYTARQDCECPEMKEFLSELDDGYNLISAGFKGLMFEGYTVAVKALSEGPFPFDFYIQQGTNLAQQFDEALETCP